MAEEMSRIKEYFYTHYLYNRKRPSINGTIDSNNISVSERANFSDILADSKRNYNKPLSAIFKEAAEKYNVPENLLVALGYEESRFKEDAISSAGAIGIMQLMPGTARSLGVTDPYDPEQNIMGGAKYLGQMLEKYKGDIDLALAAYGAGGGAVDRAGGIPAKMKPYIAKVHEFLDQGIKAPDYPVENSGVQGTISGNQRSWGNFPYMYGNITQDELNKYMDTQAKLSMMRMKMNMLKGSVDRGSIF